MTGRAARVAGPLLAAALGVGCAPSLSPAPLAPTPALDVIWVASDMAVVDEMLRLAALAPGDVLYDLGCGDGRIVISAAQRHGVRGVGVDLDPARIREARANARRAGVADRVTFIEGDLFATDLGEATVVTLYLGDWAPDASAEVLLVNRVHRLYLWRVPERSL